MAFSWRFSVTMEDRSQKARPGDATGVAGTVVAGEKSLEKPVYFERGESQRMLNLLGAPTKAEQGILEAIEYNKSYPIWVVSPAKVLKKSYATINDSAGVITTAVISDHYMMSDIAATGTFTAGCDLTKTTTSAEILLANMVEDPDKVKIYLVSDPATALTVTAAGFHNGDNSIVGTISTSATKATYALTTTTGLDADDAVVIEWTHKADSNAVLYLINRSVGQELKLDLTPKALTSTTKYIEGQISIRNYVGKMTAVSKVEFALEKGAKDGFGNSLNAETVFDVNNYVEAIYNPVFDNDTANTAGMAAAATLTYTIWTRNKGTDGTDFAAGYDFFKKFNSYPVDLFFDATGESSVPSLLATLRGNNVPDYEGFQPFASVLVPLANANTYEECTTAITAIPANRGFSVYCGRFKIRNDYSSKYPVFEGVPMGEVAKRTADSIVLSYGGLATAWIDEAGVGGLLTGGRILGYAKNQEEFSETKLKALDEAKINAITYDYTYGPMIMSRRTTYADYSDYSFNDYSRIVDYCIKNIIKNVFPYQAVKLNDEDHRAIVRMRTKAILEPLTVAPYAVLRDYAIKCDAENNNDEVLAQEQFILEVAIKVTPKSRTLKLIFINAPQTQSVEAMFED